MSLFNLKDTLGGDDHLVGDFDNNQFYGAHNESAFGGQDHNSAFGGFPGYGSHGLGQASRSGVMGGLVSPCEPSWHFSLSIVLCLLSPLYFLPIFFIRSRNNNSNKSQQDLEPQLPTLHQVLEVMQVIQDCVFLQILTTIHNVGFEFIDFLNVWK